MTQNVFLRLFALAALTFDLGKIYYNVMHYHTLEYIRAKVGLNQTPSIWEMAADTFCTFLRTTKFDGSVLAHYESG